jgi:hypothetical protein
MGFSVPPLVRVPGPAREEYRLRRFERSATLLNRFIING